MGKRSRKRNREARRRAAEGGPEVHVKLALASTDLRAAANLIKPAVLYGDRVTIYSPAASLVAAVNDLSALTDPTQQLLAIVELADAVPDLRGQLAAPAGMSWEEVGRFLSVDEQKMRRIGRLAGQSAEAEKAIEASRAFKKLWDDEMPDAVERSVRAVGAEELLVAIRANAVEVAELKDFSGRAALADAVAAASGAGSHAATDDLVSTFCDRVVEILGENRTYPLLDEQSSGLLRSLLAVRQTVPSAGALKRGAEVTSAASFMDFLPSFPDLPMDEVVDLRHQLQPPLVRFRGALAELSGEFESRSIDPEFQAEVEQAWHSQVAPALADIREALAEHGLLREVASVALGSPRRLAAEAGGVVVAAHGEIVSLSGFMTAALATALPLLDVVGQAVKDQRAANAATRKNAFYFLHRVEAEASRTGAR